MLSSCVKFSRLWLFAIWVTLCSCSLPLGNAYHSFQFDVLTDSPGIELLDYQYGVVKVGATLPGAPDTAGKIRQRGHVWANFPVGEMLIVKWRLLSTGEVFEDKVQLRGLLPENMNDHIVHFRISERTLQVFVIYPDRRDATEENITKNSLYRAFKAKRIYVNSH